MTSNFGPDESSTSPGSNPQAGSTFPSSTMRRILLQGGVASALTAMFRGEMAHGRAAGAAPGLGFENVAISTADTVVVPRGYKTQVLYSWGDATGIAGSGAAPGAGTLDGAAFSVSNTALDQTLQAGMHHDGMHYFPFEHGNRGLLVVNTNTPTMACCIQMG